LYIHQTYLKKYVKHS